MIIIIAYQYYNSYYLYAIALEALQAYETTNKDD